MAKKGSLSLPVNMLVVIILSLVVLVSGLTLLYQFIGGATQLQGQLDERTNQELQRLLVDEGQQVVLPLHIAALVPGESHTFGLGIRNIGNTQNQFTINVEFVKLVNDQEQDITTQVDRSVVESWVLYTTEEMMIREGDHRLEPIFIAIPEGVVEGQYIFKVRVLENEQQYGINQYFYVTVK